MDIDPVYEGAQSIRTKTTVNSITPELLAEIIEAIGDALADAENEKAPGSHAATSTKYGKATASNYGHVRLKDDLTGADALTTASGVAATPAALMALKAAITQLLTNLDDRININATYERTERTRLANGLANLISTHTSTERAERTQAINNINDTLNQHMTAERSERTTAINSVSENFRNSLANLRDAVNAAIEAVNSRLNNHITAGRDDAVDVTNYIRLVNTIYGWQYQGAEYGNKANACGLFCKLSELGITASSIVPSRVSFVTREDNTDSVYYRGNVYLRICNTSGQILYHSKNAVNVTGESGQLLEWDVISDTYPRLSTSENLLFLFCSSNDIAAQSVVRIGVGTSARNAYPSNVGLITLQNDKAPTATVLSWNNPNRLATYSLANLKITYFISAFDTEQLASLIQAEHNTNASQATAITALQSSLQNKVNTSTFNSLQSTVTALQSTVNNKVNTSTFNTLQSTVTALQSTVNGKATTEYVDGKCAAIKSAVRFDLIYLLPVTLQQMSYIPDSGGVLSQEDGVVYVQTQKIFAYKAGTKFYSNWPTYSDYMVGGAVRDDRIFIYEDKLYIWSDEAQDLVVASGNSEVTQDDIEAVESKIPLLFDKSRYADSMSLVARHSTSEAWATKWSIPTVTNQYAGLMSKTMYLKFLEMQQTIESQQQLISSLQSELAAFVGIIQPLYITFTISGLRNGCRMTIQKLTTTGNAIPYTFNISNGDNIIVLSPVSYPDLYASDSQGIIVLSEDFGIDSGEVCVNNQDYFNYIVTGGEADITIDLTEKYTRNESIHLYLTCNEY